MLHNMSGNDYRAGRAVLHCVIDRGLRDRIGVAAGVAGVSVTAWVAGVLEDALDAGVVEVEPVRLGRDVLAGVVAAGLVREARASVALDREQTHTVGVYSVDRDPLEEIA